ncbi:larval cuticle protein 65Ag1-like [Oratosquilla oratoria]|uniref:larval cuticle protein 65Ag1-like n=1 Tax=Oratosquilla oratoria TaxID=337810 RepID=UPI003F764996
MYSFSSPYITNMKFLIFVTALLAFAIADFDSREEPIHIPIVAETRKEPVAGASASDFEAANGNSKKRLHQLLHLTHFSWVVGSYPDEFGNVIEVRYIANEYDFQPQGVHLPVAPPAPAHVAELLRIAEEQRAAGITFK